MPDTIKPYKDSQLGKKEQVSQMFDNISTQYDGLNRVISFGIDKRWRKEVVQMVLDSKAASVLDMATGTGDLAIQIAANSKAEIVGMDISKGMLEVGIQKIAEKSLSNRIDMVYGDAENIPYNDESFDAATVAFGVRNFENLDKGLSEILRVLKPGGRLIVLETSVPTRFPFKQGYKLYTHFLLPLIGKIFSKDRVAYAYLSESANNFPYGEKFNNILKKIGFTEVRHLPRTFGVATIYEAKK
jgi:demethylmenaquinone methyltransferase/2-methoxy-6-polyprenyl-1,4-benzoquinol methylase